MRTLAFRLLLICSQFAVLGQESNQILIDLQVLSADSLEGRATATAGSQKAQKYIEARFNEIGLKRYDDSFRRNFILKESQKTGTNLIGYIPGTSDSCVVITAHYDHLGIKDGKIFNGADDNASGVSGLLAIASELSKSIPKYTILFAALDAEEIGLKGAEALLLESPIDISLIKLNINMDMISHTDANEFYAVGSYHYPSLLPILERVRSTASIRLILGHDKPKDKLEDWTFSSDHYPFHKRRIPFIYFGVEDHKDYHKETDTFENTNAVFIQEAIKTIIAVLREVNANY